MAVKWLWLTSKHWLYDNDIGANYSHGTGGNVTFKTYNNHTDTCGDHFNGDYSLFFLGYSNIITTATVILLLSVSSW